MWRQVLAQDVDLAWSADPLPWLAAPQVRTHVHSNKRTVAPPPRHIGRLARSASCRAASCATAPIGSRPQVRATRPEHSLAVESLVVTPAPCAAAVHDWAVPGVSFGRLHRGHDSAAQVCSQHPACGDALPWGDHRVRCDDVRRRADARRAARDDGALAVPRARGGRRAPGRGGAEGARRADDDRCGNAHRATHIGTTSLSECEARVHLSQTSGGTASAQPTPGSSSCGALTE